MAIPALLALAALAAGGAVAQTTVPQPSVETLMYHMDYDKSVKKARKAYVSAVNAAMLYSLCPAEYHVDDAKKARFNAELQKEDRALRAAYSASHQALTNKLPSDTVLKAIDADIAKLQYEKAMKLGTMIKGHPTGCKQSALKFIDNYYEDKYAYELQQQAAAEEKRRQEVPAVNEPQQETRH